MIKDSFAFGGNEYRFDISMRQRPDNVSDAYFIGKYKNQLLIFVFASRFLKITFVAKNLILKKKKCWGGNRFS